ncbi:M20 family metallopeptidase [Glycomyces tenuis]|uniref:M20 family metallopeptidase n=1 Tax=Glycomyces tenuis TaxID=58116 RepID=UPI0004009E82|nr:M20 family metallopeptidase [Glycomyces tenuis]
MTEFEARAERLLPDMIADIETLVRAESPTDDTEALARSADVLTAMGRGHLGSTPERVEVERRPHLVWRLGAGPRRLLLLAHHDTVWPFGSWGERIWKVEDGVIRGPGCLDMAGGIVQAMYALRLLAETRATLDGVTFLVTADEEIGSPTARELIEREAAPCQAVFVLEPGGPHGELKTERKGSSRYTVHVTGRAAHAGLEPERGVNAGVELAHHVLAVDTLADRAAGTTVTPTVMSAGTTTNTVPAQGALHVDVRTSSLAEQRRVDRALRELTPFEEGAAVAVEGGPSRPPLPPESSADLFARAERVAADAGLAPLRAIASGAVSDGNLTAHLGIPTLDGLGAVGGGAHADGEHVTASAIPGRTALLALLIADRLAARRPRGGRPSNRPS